MTSEQAKTIAANLVATARREHHDRWGAMTLGEQSAAALGLPPFGQCVIDLLDRAKRTDDSLEDRS